MHNILRYIEPKVIRNAQVKIKDFYYTNTISVSVSQEVKKDASLARGTAVLFYFVSDDVVLETIGLDVSDLVSFEEVWVKRPLIETELYTNDTFDTYSYFTAIPF